MLAGSLVVIVGMIPGVVVLWYALCRNGQTREAGPEQQDWVLSIVLRLVSLLKRAGGHKSGLHFFLASTAIPLCIMCWANLYFSSVLVSTGVLLIYGAPFLMSYLRLPSTLSFSLPLLPSCTLWSRAIRNNNYATHQSSDAAAGKAKLEDSNFDDRAAAYTTARRDVGEVHPEAFSFWLTTEGAGGCGRVLAKGHISTAAACLLAIVAGHIAFLGSLDVVHPNVIPLAAPILGIFRMDLNKNYGIYCLAFVSASAFYIFGFMYLLFEKEGKLPAQGFFSKKRSNLFVIAFAIFSIVRGLLPFRCSYLWFSSSSVHHPVHVCHQVFLRLSLPGTKWKWILISPSLVTYSTCLQRVSFGHLFPPLFPLLRCSSLMDASERTNETAYHLSRTMPSSFQGWAIGTCCGSLSSSGSTSPRGEGPMSRPPRSSPRGCSSSSSSPTPFGRYSALSLSLFLFLFGR